MNGSARINHEKIPDEMLAVPYTNPAFLSVR